MSRHKVKRPRKWVQKTGIAKHKGALHRALGIPEGQIIPLATLHKAADESGHVGHMARMAITMRGFKHHHGHHHSK